MMGINDLLNDVGYYLSKAARALALAGALYGCGGEERTGCRDDNDCQGERICEKGECTYPRSDGDKKPKEFTCEDACQGMYACDENDWGAYDSKDACVRDCEEDPWSKNMMECMSTRCDIDCSRLCDSDDDCNGYYYCINDSCQPMPCKFDSDCEENLVCRGNNCM